MGARAVYRGRRGDVGTLSPVSRCDSVLIKRINLIIVTIVYMIYYHHGRFIETQKLSVHVPLKADVDREAGVQDELCHA